MIRLHKIAWALILVVGLSAVASASSAAGLAVGILDTGKVNAEAPRIKQLAEKLDTLGAQLDAKIRIRLQNTMLTEEQVKELIDLKLKANPSEKEKARIKEHGDLERANDEELKKLQSTAQPDEKQKARLAELNEIQRKAKVLADQVAQDYATQYKNEGINLSNKADTELRDAVKKVAEAKKLAFVFDKDTVFFGGTDITSEVIGRLDRRSD